MLMEEDPDYVTDEERQEYVTIIYNTTNEMINLLNDLLDVSVIESGKLEIEPVKGSLKTLIEERIRLSRVVAGKKGIIIHQHLENVPPVPFDSNRISQVFENLISNAIKFSPRDSEIHIYLSAGEDTVRVSVKDEGPGLPREEFDKLFDVYERLSVKPTGGEKSTGLGLSIVKKVIDAHRGQVEVESEVGSGSTFSFVLPLG
jgi:signal transduction histidine kinase